MIRKILPVMVALLGTGGGVAAGMWLGHGTRADPMEVPDDAALSRSARTGSEAESGTEFVKLNNQFVIPVVKHDRINALVVMSLTVELERGAAQQVHDREPKLRDAFLQLLFDHANMGGFAGDFTGSNSMDALRVSLTEEATRLLGDTAKGVLITEVARQDI